MPQKKEILKVKNCVICNKKGKLFFREKYTDKIFKDFFSNFYGKSKSKSLIKRLKKINFELLKCNSCEFVWQKNQPINSFANNLYSKIIDDKKSFLKSKKIFRENRNKFNNELNLICNSLKKKRLKVLDYGAGWGAWIRSIKLENVNLYAYELSNKRNRFLKKFNINVLDYKKIKLKKNEFDYIRLEQVLEHLPDLDKCLKLIKMISTKDIIIDISVPNGKKNILNPHIVNIQKGPVQPLEHINCFSNKSLKKLFANYGFRSISIFELFKFYLSNSFFQVSSFKFLIKNIVQNYFSTSIKFKLK